MVPEVGDLKINTRGHKKRKQTYILFKCMLTFPPFFLLVSLQNTVYRGYFQRIVNLLNKIIYGGKRLGTFAFSLS